MASRAFKSLVRIRSVSSPPTPSSAPDRPRIGGGSQLSTIEQRTYPHSTIPWSNVVSLRVRFRPCAKSDTAVNAWILGLQSLKRGEKRSWDPREGSGGEDSSWPLLAISAGGPSRVRVVYRDGSKRTFSPSNFSLEQVSAYVLSTSTAQTTSLHSPRTFRLCKP